MIGEINADPAFKKKMLEGGFAMLDIDAAGRSFRDPLVIAGPAVTGHQKARSTGQVSGESGIAGEEDDAGLYW